MSKNCRECDGNGFVNKDGEEQTCSNCGGTGLRQKGKSEDKTEKDSGRFVNK